MPPSIDQAVRDAVRLHQAGRLDDAEAAYRALLSAGHQHPELHHYFGVLLHHRGRPAEAVAQLQFAIALKPGEARFYTNAVPALLAMGRVDDAIDACRKAVSINPGSADAHYQLGIVSRIKGDFESAIACYRKAIELDPRHAPAWNALGLRLSDRGDSDDAMRCYERALQVDPRFADAHNNIGVLLKAAGHLGEAQARFQTALTLQPNNAETHANLGSLLKDMGDIDGALAETQRALQIQPNSKIGSNLLYTMLFDERVSPAHLCEAHRAWAREFAPPADHIEIVDRSPDRRLRVGYVSPDFREHPIGRFMLPLLANHDKSHFEIHCYSDAVRPDALTQALSQHVDRWRATRGLSDEELIRQIRADQVDVVFDLTMHMESSRVLAFARRCAPVQATYLAYAGTTGVPAMDYRMTDTLLDPPGEHDAFYTEQSVHLRSYWCYAAPAQALEPGELPAQRNGFVTFGSLNNFCKITPTTFAAWVEILKRLPTARMIIHARNGSHRQNMFDRFAGVGIDPQRIAFAGIQSPAEYFAVYQRIDVALDPFPYPGGTTTCDALWMGVPVVTLPGDSGISRGGLSILSQLDLCNWVARDVNNYVQIALNIAADLNGLNEHRRTLRGRMRQSPLMDATAFARDFEAVIRRMWLRTVT